MLNFFFRLVKNMGPPIPDTDELYLPHFSKTDFYFVYKNQLSILFTNEEYKSRSYLLATWKDQHLRINVLKVPRFVSCTKCDLFLSINRDAVKGGHNTVELVAH